LLSYLFVVCETNWPCVQAVIDVRLPKKGEYGLEIFANDPGKEGDMFTHVCQYLCFYVDGRPEDLYGKMPGKEPETMEHRGETGDCLRIFTCTLCLVIL